MTHVHNFAGSESAIPSHHASGVRFRGWRPCGIQRRCFPHSGKMVQHVSWCSIWAPRVNTSECMVIIHVAYGDGHVLWGSIRPRESFWTCHVPRVLLPSRLGQLYLHRNRARVGKSDHCRVQHNGPQVTLSEMLRWGEKWWEELSGS